MNKLSLELTDKCGEDIAGQDIMKIDSLDFSKQLFHRFEEDDHIILSIIYFILNILIL